MSSGRSEMAVRHDAETCALSRCPVGKHFNQVTAMDELMDDDAALVGEFANATRNGGSLNGSLKMPLDDEKAQRWVGHISWQILANPSSRGREAG